MDLFVTRIIFHRATMSDDERPIFYAASHDTNLSPPRI